MAKIKLKDILQLAPLLVGGGLYAAKQGGLFPGLLGGGPQAPGKPMDLPGAVPPQAEGATALKAPVTDVKGGVTLSGAGGAPVPAGLQPAPTPPPIGVPSILPSGIDIAQGRGVAPMGGGLPSGSPMLPAFATSPGAGGVTPEAPRPPLPPPSPTAAYGAMPYLDPFLQMLAKSSVGAGGAIPGAIGEIGRGTAALGVGAAGRAAPAAQRMLPAPALRLPAPAAGSVAREAPAMSAVPFPQGVKPSPTYWTEGGQGMTPSLLDVPSLNVVKGATERYAPWQAPLMNNPAQALKNPFLGPEIANRPNYGAVPEDYISPFLRYPGVRGLL